jgi:TatD DNase family protein
MPELVTFGGYLSFKPAFLEPRKSRLAATSKYIPAERLLAETNAPAKPPPQIRRTHKLPLGEERATLNYPGNLEAAYAGLAALLGQDGPKLAAQLEANFYRLFAPS